MNIQPLNDRVIVKRLDAESMSPGGIALPEVAKDQPDQGLVVAVGPGKRSEMGGREPMDVVAGQKVLFGKYSGQTVKVDGNDYLVMGQGDIWGILG